MPQYNTYDPAAPLSGNEIILVEQGGVTLRTNPIAIRNYLNYTIPVATGSILGGVLSGGDITINGIGTVTVNDNSHNHLWSNITGTPTTIAGYGITDASLVGHSHAWTALTGTPTTLAGYGIVDAAPLSHVGGSQHIDWSVTGAEIIHADRYTDTDNDTTDHTLFSNIGTNTHAQIDTHLALTAEHIDWSITGVENIHADRYDNNDTTDHTLLSNIGTNTHAQIDTHIADSTLHFTKSSITLTDLSDTVGTFSGLTDGQVLTYDSVNGWQNETIPSGITDHTLLSNIGTNTHAQIDTHLALTAEHIDWSVTGGTVIHADRYTDTVYVLPVADTGILGGVRDGTDISVDVTGNVSVVDNSHNHIWSNINSTPTTLAGYGITDATPSSHIGGNIHIDWSITGVEDIHADRYTDTTYVNSDWDHDQLTNYLAEEHIDWSVTGVEDIHADRYTDTIYTHPTTPGNKHIPSGGSTGQVVTWLSDGTGQWSTPSEGITDHTLLSNIGTNTHAAIDTHLALTNQHIDWTAGTGAGFHSLGINDDATGEALKLTDNRLVFGNNAGSVGIVRELDSQSLWVNGGDNYNTGGGIWLYGQNHATLANDIQFWANGGIEAHYDHSASLWDFQANLLKTSWGLTLVGGGVISADVRDDSVLIYGGTNYNTGAGLQLFGDTHSSRAEDVIFYSLSGTEQLCFDSSATLWDFKTNALTCGALTSKGINDDATGQRLKLTDGYLYLGTTGSNYEIRHIGASDILKIHGSDSSASGAIWLYGFSHSTQAKDIELKSDNTTVLHYDFSATTFELKASDIILTHATASSSVDIIRDGTTGVISIEGSDDSSGAELLLYGSAHTSFAGDIVFRSSGGEALRYDKSARSGSGEWDFGYKPIAWDFTSVDEGFLHFAASADADTTSAISTYTTSGATTHHIQIDINGTKAWIAASTNNPSA